MKKLIFQNNKIFMNSFTDDVFKEHFACCTSLNDAKKLYENIKIHSLFDHNQTLEKIHFIHIEELELKLAKVQSTAKTVLNNIENIITFLSTNNFLKFIIFDEDLDNLYLYKDIYGAIQIRNGKNKIIAKFIVNKDAILNKQLSAIDMMETAATNFEWHFELGDVIFHQYNHYKNNLKDDKQFKTMTENHISLINEINSMFQTYPLCLQNVAALNNQCIEFIPKKARTIDDIYDSYKIDGIELQDYENLKTFVYEKYKSVWDNLKIQDFETFNSTYDHLMVMEKGFEENGYEILIKPSMINEKCELRVYFHSVKNFFNVRYYFVFPDKDAIESPIIFKQPDEQVFESAATDFRLSDVFSGEFIEYLKLFEY